MAKNKQKNINKTKPHRTNYNLCNPESETFKRKCKGIIKSYTYIQTKIRIKKTTTTTKKNKKRFIEMLISQIPEANKKKAKTQTTKTVSIGDERKKEVKANITHEKTNGQTTTGSQIILKHDNIQT